MLARLALLLLPLLPLATAAPADHVDPVDARRQYEYEYWLGKVDDKDAKKKKPKQRLPPVQENIEAGVGNGYPLQHSKKVRQGGSGGRHSQDLWDVYNLHRYGVSAIFGGGEKNLRWFNLCKLANIILPAPVLR